MPIIFADRAWETVTTTGTGAFAIGLPAYGYIAGGVGGSGVVANPVALVQRTQLVSETTSLLGTAQITSPRASAAGVSNGSTEGFFVGGTLAGSSTTALTEKITYSSETTASQTSANLPIADANQSGMANGTTAGYVAGGSSANNNGGVYKLTFATSAMSASTVAALTVVRNTPAAVSDPGTAGYISGGRNIALTQVSTTTDKLTYSSDTVAAQTTAALSPATADQSGCNNGTAAGYVSGGRTSYGASAPVTATQKITYAGDTQSTVTSAALSAGRSNMAAVQLESASGFFSGGATSADSSNVPVAVADRLAFATETTTAVTTANLAVPAVAPAGVWSTGSGSPASKCQRIADETGTNVQVHYTAVHQTVAEWEVGRGTVTGGSLSRDTVYASSNSNNAVSFSAGTKDLVVLVGAAGFRSLQGGVEVATLTAGESLSERDTVVLGPDGLVYEFDTTVPLMSDYAWPLGFCVNSASAGQPVGVRITGELDGFSSLTAGSWYCATGTTGGLAAGKRRVMGVATSSTTVYVDTSSYYGADEGYCIGGVTTTTAAVATADKMTYAVETLAAQTTANASSSRTGAGLSEGGIKGYCLGGSTALASGGVTTADKVTYATDTTAAQTTANLSQARRPTTITEGFSKGYALGGTTAANTPVATANKITFSNDTTAAQTTANLSGVRAFGSGITQAGYKGYHLGGTSAGTTGHLATTDRIIYATDTTAVLTTANLTQARFYTVGVSAWTKGYTAGGQASSALLTTSNRTAYATDATTAVTSVNLRAARAAMSSLSDGLSRGWVAGGMSTTSAFVNVAERLSFALDADSAIAATLSSSRAYAAGVSHANC